MTEIKMQRIATEKNTLCLCRMVLFWLVQNLSSEKHIVETKQLKERFRTSRNDRQFVIPLLLYYPQEKMIKYGYEMHSVLPIHHTTAR
jgi:hypothetical protein